MPSHLALLLRDLVTVRESPARWPIAVPAGLSMALPVAVCSLVGHPDLGLMASSGSFLCLYYTYESRRVRAARLPLVAAALFTAAALGVLTSGHSTLALWTLAGVAVVAAVLAFGLHVGPPGAVFVVLSTGVSERLAAPVADGGAGFSGWLVLGMLLAGMATAYAVTMAPMLLPRVRSRDRALFHGHHREPFSFDRVSRIITSRLVVGVILATLVCLPLGVHRAYWVLMTLVAILQAGYFIRLTIARGIHRVVGTLLGMGVFAAFWFLSPTGVVLALVLGCLQAATELLVTRNYGIALLTITPLAMTIATQSHQDPTFDVLRTRLVDTLVGAAVALVVLLGSKVVQDLLWRHEPHWQDV